MTTSLLTGLFFLVLTRLCQPTKLAQTNCGIQRWKPPSNSASALNIVGGERATANSWPWQAYVQVVEDRVFASYSLSCGATLILPDFLLTAAHCVQDVTDNYVVSVYVGTHKLSQMFPFNSGRVEAIYVHPDYKREDQSNDIALLKLTSPLTYSKKISPICLDNGQMGLDESAAPAYATGWGHYSGPNDDVVINKMSSELLQASVPIVDCSKVYGLFFPSNRLCAGAFRRGVGKGDSGGPLQVLAKNGQWYQVGIISLSVGDGIGGVFKKQFPDVYTKVSSYYDFIRSCTNDTSTCHLVRVSRSIPKRTMVLIIGAALILAIFVLDICLCTCR